MALIDDEEHIFREIIQETIRRCTGFTTIEVTAVVLHAGAVAEFVQHLQIVFDAFLYAFGIQFFTDGGEVLYLLGEVGFDLLFCISDAFWRSEEDGRRREVIVVKFLKHLSADRVNGQNGVYLIAEILDAHNVISVRKGDINGIPLNAETPARKFYIITDILGGYKLLEQRVHRHLLAALQFYHVLREVLRRSQTVDATDGRDNNDVFPSGEQRRHGTQPQSVDLFVDTQVFLDVQVCTRDVRFGLVIVVVRDEILHGVVRKEGFHLRVQLRREGLIMAHDERRTIQLFYDIRHGKCLAATRHAEQYLRLCAGFNAVNQSLDSFRLIACRFIWTF